MNQFKQIVFLRVKKQKGEKQVQNNQGNVQQLRINAVKKIIKEFIAWTEYHEQYQVNELFLNYQSKAIYNNGLIVYKLSHNQFYTELLQSVPRQYSNITRGTVLQNYRYNFVNFQFKKMMYYSDPKPLFETFGYKQLNKLQFKEDIECFKSYSYGIEIYLYKRQKYIQISETFDKLESEQQNSVANQLVKLLTPFIEMNPEVKILSQNFKPDDFIQTDIQ